MTAKLNDRIFSDLASIDSEAPHADDTSVAASLEIVADMLREIIRLQQLQQERTMRMAEEMQQQINCLKADVCELRATQTHKWLR